jgi:hypothetical protein
MNANDAKDFYDSLQIEERYKSRIDNSVYKSPQTFRLFGHVKLGQNRVKRFHETFVHRGISYTHKYEMSPIDSKHKEYMILRESLISQTKLDELKIIPSLVIRAEKPTYSNETYSKESMDAIIGECQQFLGNDFKIVEITDGNLILLSRQKPTYCKMCNRTHHSENPFLTLRKRDHVIYVYWNCRRSADKSEMIHAIMLDSPIESEPDVVPTSHITVLPRRERIHLLIDETLPEFDRISRDVMHGITSGLTHKFTTSNKDIPQSRIDEINRSLMHSILKRR